MNDTIEQRIGTVEKRLDRIERQLHLGPLVELQMPLHTGPALAKAAAIEQQEPVRTAVVPHPPPPPLPVMEPSPAPRKVMPYCPPKMTRRVGEAGLEQTIGLKWAGWIGAIVLLIGAALGVKYAYDQHWFRQLPVWVWPSIIAAIGLALIGIGEWVYRKVNVIPGASLFGAGIATLFLDSYVGHSYYALYSPSTAFILMAITTWIGSAVAMRGRLVSIAVLSQIGGSIAPLVMGDSGAPHTAFMTYLLMLQIIALVLAWWGRSPRWWTLRGVSLATTTLWMTAIIVPGADGQLPLFFALVYAALYQLETIVSSMRADAEPQWTHIRHNGAAFTTFVTADLTAAMLGVLHDSPTILQVTWILVFALVNGVLGFVLPTKDRPLTRALTIAYRACAVALVAVAVPVGMHGLSIEIAWGFLAIVLALLGWYLKSNISRAGSVAVWIAALVHLVLSLPVVDVLDSHSQMHICMTLAGVAITTATVLAWGLALVGQVIAELSLSETPSQKHRSNDRAAVVLSYFASAVWVITSLLALPPVGATLMLLLYAALMGAVAKFLPRLQTSMQMMILLILATTKWMIVDTLGQRFSPGWTGPTHYLPFINSTIDMGLLLAASLLGLAWLRRQSSPAAISVGRVSPFAMLGLLTIAWTITFEIDRAFSSTVAVGWFTDAQLAKQVAFSIIWSIFAVVAVAIGFRIRVAGLRYFGLALLAFTLLKVVTIDLAQVSTGYRILSFLGLGLLMLGTSVLYGKLSPRLLAVNSSQTAQ